MTRARDAAILLAHGEEADALFEEVNRSPRYGIRFSSRDITDTEANIIVADESHGPELSPELVNNRHILAFADVYEEVFDQVPLSHLRRAWFGEHALASTPFLYALLKRVIDIVGGIAMSVVTVLVAPFVFIGNLIEGSGPLFIAQERLGQFGRRIRVYKFRSMEKNNAASGEWVHEGEKQNRVTRVGAFLRKTSLDEFPQCINVITGELSLIGPRSDILGLGLRLKEALPYYEARYRVRPGITGWAQINQRYESGNVSPQSIEENKTRLAYDFYYLKHRSLGLDIVIALKTAKRMFFRLSSW